MVVMAIITILATAGVSAYTGYLKKARDAKRMADIHAMNKIVLGTMGTTGMPPDMVTLRIAIMEANNGVLFRDVMHGLPCLGSGNCWYMYTRCDEGVGWSLGTRFEHTSNLPLYTNDQGYRDNLYEVGSCTTPYLLNGII